MTQVKIRVMNRTALEVWLDQVVSLDSKMCAHLGKNYSNITWSDENFRLDLPHKWALSQLALDGEEVIGFWIASSVVSKVCHTHRVAVNPSVARHGIGRMMFESLLSSVRNCNEVIDYFTLEVGRENVHALNFYHKLGFNILHRQKIEDYLGNRGRIAKVHKDYLEEADGSLFHVMCYHQ